MAIRSQHSLFLKGRMLTCRRHCNQEPDWAVPATLLDEFDGAGWGLIIDLITGNKSAQELLTNEFVLAM